MATRPPRRLVLREVFTEEVGERFHLGEFGHGPTLRAGPDGGAMAADGADEERVCVRITIDAPAETVWSALREPHEIERWHGWHYDELEAEIDAIFLSDVTEHPRGADPRHQRGRAVRARTGGRRRRAAHSASHRAWTPTSTARTGTGGTTRSTRAGRTFVHQLRFLLERHPGQDRRTLRIDDDRPSVASVWQLLGLSDLVGPGAPAVGERYEARLSGGGRDGGGADLR